MIKLGNDGYYYISDNNIKYDLYEGMTIGKEERKTSDIIFILIQPQYINYDNCNEFVGYFYGDIYENEDFIKILVDKFEIENKNGINFIGEK